MISSTSRTKALVLELLAAVCLVRGGHEIILSAFDNFKEVINHLSLFYLDFEMATGCPNLKGDRSLR